MSDIPLLLQRGWENVWKEKLIWLFGSLLLLDLLVQLIPIQYDSELAFSFSRLIKSSSSILLSTASFIGVVYIAYCIANEKPVDFKTTSSVIRKFFWITVVSFVTITIFLAPFFCLALFLSINQKIQSTLFAHNAYIIQIPTAIISALQCFLIIEIITSETLIWESLKVSWSVYKSRFFQLATIGVILGLTAHALDIVIGVTITLFQQGFDFTSLRKFDFISPNLSFTNNFFFEATTTIAQIFWVNYGVSIFALAHSKYKGAPKNKRVKY